MFHWYLYKVNGHTFTSNGCTLFPTLFCYVRLYLSMKFCFDTRLPHQIQLYKSSFIITLPVMKPEYPGWTSCHPLPHYSPRPFKFPLLSTKNDLCHLYRFSVAKWCKVQVYFDASTIIFSATSAYIVYLCSIIVFCGDDGGGHGQYDEYDQQPEK